MRFLKLLALVTFLTLMLARAQRVADQQEYDLVRRAGQERDAATQLRLLREWEAAYPTSELQRSRIQMFVDAYERLGQLTDAFAQAVQLFKLDAKDIMASAYVSAIGPRLPAPSRDQIDATREAAANLLLRVPELGRAQRARAQMEDGARPQRVSDPDLRRLSEFITELRRERSNSGPDEATALKAVAERALAWVQNVSK